MLETKISNFIEKQFPDLYQEEGAFFVEFMKQYYIWLETDETSPVYHARNFIQNHDVDTAVDSFIIYFKEKYLKNIQLNTATNTQQLIKNSIDLYRSKGTENAIKLFFDLIFSAPSEVYYPGEDVFKLSSAEWTIPKYIEVTSKPVNRLMVGRQVRGVYSGATAFVEKLVRRRAKNTYIEVFYISAIRGSFSTGEIITLSDDTTIPVTDFPSMIGSLNALRVEDGGDGFKLGEVVDLESRSGTQGKAVVQKLNTITGIVEFDLEDGGWGYTSNSSITVSEKVLRLSNVVLQTTSNTSLYNKISSVYQPQANVQWYDNTAAFAVGDIVYNYEANGVNRGISTIISAEYGNTTTSYFLLSTNSGNSAPYTPMVYTYYSAGNTSNFKVYNAGWVDVSATGNVVGMSSNVDITCVGNSSNFTADHFVYQISSNNAVFARAKVIEVQNTAPNTFVITVNSLEGLFLTNHTLYNENNGNTVAISYASFDIGVNDTTHNFNTMAGNLLKDRSSNSLFSASIYQVPFGSGASIDFDTDLVDTESIQVNTNFVRDHLDDLDQANWINTTSYGASLNTANLNHLTLGEALMYDTMTLGTIAKLQLANPGEGYSYAPFAIARDPFVAPLTKLDFVIRISNPTGIFTINELVTQTVNGAKGLVKFANTSEVHVRRLTYEDRWQVGNTSTYMMTGRVSGFEAEVTEVTPAIYGIAGDNAVISTNVTSSDSSVASLKVVDSGFNFRDNDLVSFSSLDKKRAGGARSVVLTHGTASGYHKTTSGFLSSNKYLHDGEYYQDFSYEIKSPITIDRYSDMLKNVLHVSGTKSFSSILINNSTDSTSTASSIIETDDGV